MRFVQVVNAPCQPSFCVAPRPEAVDVEVSNSEYFGSAFQIAADLGPKLSPAVKSAAEKSEEIIFHAGVLVSYLRLHQRRARPHPVFVAFSRLQNIHISSSYDLTSMKSVGSQKQRLRSFNLCLDLDERRALVLGRLSIQNLYSSDSLLGFTATILVSLSGAARAFVIRLW